MLLRHRITAPSQSKEQIQALSQEDAWLNDVGPSSQSKSSTSSTVNQSEIEQPSSPFPSPSSINEHIGVGHRLWPIVLHISQHIWQEVYQKPDVTSLPEPLLTTFVQKQVIDILRRESNIAQQICDVTEAQQVLQSIINEVIGTGPLESLLKDESVSEIMAVGPHFIDVERNGQREDVAYFFEDDRHMVRIIANMLRKAGRRLQPSCPIVDVRLPDGSLVNVVMPPNAVNGPMITIRKGTKKPLTIEELIALGTLSQEMAEFLCACIQARLNIVICGAIDSGRTTLLNALSAYIPAEERIATIEEVAELHLTQRHVVGLIAQATGPGSGGLTLSDLVVNALRVGSERILLGECRGDEVVEVLQAVSNGYNGFLMTLYAHGLRNCLTRLETLCMARDTTLPLSMIRTQIATALDVIVHVARLRDGSPKVVNIAEVLGFENGGNGGIKLQSIFHYGNDGPGATSDEGRWGFEPSSFCPTFLPKLEATGIHLPREMFEPIGKIQEDV